jgi:hypothetical protein
MKRGYQDITRDEGYLDITGIKDIVRISQGYYSMDDVL